MTILLDISPDIAVSRKSLDRDRYEADLMLQNRVRESYLRQAKQHGWLVVNGAGDVETVSDSVIQVVTPSIPALD